jgi:hypothetical protein
MKSHPSGRPYRHLWAERLKNSRREWRHCAICRELLGNPLVEAQHQFIPPIEMFVKTTYRNTGRLHFIGNANAVANRVREIGSCNV